MTKKPRKKVNMVQVYLISSNSPPKREIGDPLAFGPYMWVLAEHEERFIAEMKKRHSKDGRVADIRTIQRAKRRISVNAKCWTFDEEVRIFEEFLSDRSNWEV